jgi:poly(beta-D-mannuronate) lyase
MKYLLIAIYTITGIPLYATDRTATSVAELNTLATNAKAGDHIYLKDGVYKDAVIKFSNHAGTEESLITIGAQHPGKVFLEGNSSISFSGKYIHIKDLVFQNGGHELKNKQVIEFRVSEKEQASHCTVSDCVIDDFNNTVKTDVNAWVGIYGEYNVVERCLFRSKDNMGPTLVVWLDSGRAAHHTIAENYFLTRINGAQVDNGLESIRVGDSKTSFTDAHCVIAFNRFEDCDGEIEIISNKSCHNSYLHNTFYNCDGGLTLRHGNHTLCDGNYFDGHQKKLSYGIRFIGEGQVAINNYFRNLHGSSHELYRSPVSLLNGLVNTPINGYYQVRNAVVTDNIFMDCETPLIRIGAFSPKRDGMSIAPDTVTIQDNVFANSNNATGEVLEIITPASHFTATRNKISKGYTIAQPGSFTEMEKSNEKSIAQFDYPAILKLNKGAGAEWVSPKIRDKMKGVKYTYSLADQVGPKWRVISN